MEPHASDLAACVSQRLRKSRHDHPAESFVAPKLRVLIPGPSEADKQAIGKIPGGLVLVDLEVAKEGFSCATSCHMLSPTTSEHDAKLISSQLRVGSGSKIRERGKKRGQGRRQKKKGGENRERKREGNVGGKSPKTLTKGPRIQSNPQLARS